MEKKKWIAGAGTLLLAGVVLAGCGDEEAGQTIETSASELAESDEIIEAEERVFQTQTRILQDGTEVVRDITDKSLGFTQKDKELHNKVMEYYSDYELPEEGKVDENDPRYGEGHGKVDPELYILYENGYVFGKIHQQYDKNTNEEDGHELIENLSPLPGQEPALVHGFIKDIGRVSNLDNITEESGDTWHIKWIKAAKELTDSKPLEEWLEKRIQGWEAASTLEDIEAIEAAYRTEIDHFIAMEDSIRNQIPF